MLSKKDKDLFAAQWRWRQRKAEPYREVERRGFLRAHWGIITLGVVISIIVGACLYDQLNTGDKIHESRKQTTSGNQ